jgi:hypothetical protein
MAGEHDWMNALFAKPPHHSLDELVFAPRAPYPARGNPLAKNFSDPPLPGSCPPLPGSFGNALAPARPGTNWLEALARSAPPPRTLQPTALGGLLAPTQKRMVYFAFAFADQMRVNNVRQFGKIGPRECKNARHFRDRSIWESRDIKTVEGLKVLMRNAMKQSSVVCALVGSTTWNSRWAKYEIARSIIDGKGLLAVHINSINHHQRKAPDRLGVNPLHMMGIYRSRNGYYLVDRHPVLLNAAMAEVGFEWRFYDDYKDPVSLPAYMSPMGLETVVALSHHTHEYDMIADGGYQNLWSWIETAAVVSGR